MKNTLFNELFSTLDGSCANNILHKRIKDVGDVYTADFELAGFAKEDISISASSEVLKIFAKNEDRKKSFTINLYDTVSVDHIKCSMKNGLLKLTLPKKGVSESRKIEIE